MLVLAAILSLMWYLGPAAVRNLTGLILTHRLQRTGVLMSPIARDNPGRPLWELDDNAISWLPSSPMRPVLEGWEALLAGRTKDAADAFLRASDQGSGYTRSLDDFVSRAEEQRQVLPTMAPPGLAEYEYGLAMRAVEAHVWALGLEDFERAVVHRPGPWPDSFYTAYSTALTWAAPEVAQSIALEVNHAPAPDPQIRVGRKEQPGWETPVFVTGGWYLQGFTVHSWTAMDYGFPTAVEFFWTNNLGHVERQTVQAWNLVANGGFELGVDRQPGYLMGWFRPADAVAGFESPLWRTVWRDGGLETALVLLPRGLQDSDETLSRLVQVRPQTYLLWSAWIENTGEGNPHIFVEWRDVRQRLIGTEIPMQGQAHGAGRYYAGVLEAPPGAVYLSISLVNVGALGESWYDDLLFLPLRPPAP